MNSPSFKFTRVALIYVVVLIFSVSLIAIWYHLEASWPYCGYGFETKEKRLVISKIHPNTPAEKVGLQAGDVVTEFAGLPITSENVENGEWYWKSIKDRRWQPGKEISIVVDRQGEELVKTLTPISALDGISSRFEQILQFIVLSLIGLVLVIKKPESSAARILAFCMLAVSVFYFGIYVPRSMISWLDLLRKIGFQASVFYSPLLLHFVLIHPERKKLINKYPAIIPVIYLPFVLFFVYGLIVEFYTYFFANGKLTILISQIEPYSLPRVIFRFFIGLLVVIVILYSYYKASSMNNKRRLKWMLIGLLAGLIPIIIIEFMWTFAPLLPPTAPMSKIINNLHTIFFCAIPIFFAWSVLLKDKEVASEKQ